MHLNISHYIIKYTTFDEKLIFILYFQVFLIWNMFNIFKYTRIAIWDKYLKLLIILCVVQRENDIIKKMNQLFKC